MVRTRFHQIAKLGHFKETLEWANELDRLCRKKGLVKTRFLSPAFGKTNHLIFENEYPDWAAYQKEQNAFFSDLEIMTLFRKGIDFREPGELPWSEAEEEAPLLA